MAQLVRKNGQRQMNQITEKETEIGTTMQPVIKGMKVKAVSDIALPPSDWHREKSDGITYGQRWGMGSHHICVLGRQNREIEEGVISQVRGFPRSPTTCHQTLLCHIFTSVKKAGKHHFLARSIIAQIMVLTLRKMEGLGLCHTPGRSFCWACPWPETQGSKASAQTTDPLARGPRVPKPPPLADEASDLQRSPDQ